jgi:predicted Fe-Mo cluster-binding NifX family protein
MKIAIPLTGLRLADHCEKTDQFALIDAEGGTGNIYRFALLTAPALEPGELPRWLLEQGTQVVIASGMEPQTQRLFTEKAIIVKGGIPGESPENLVRLLCQENPVETGACCNH